MGFINNTSYILNAVLTRKGKEYLAKSGGEFKITKFALSDDEVDYSLWDTAHPKGTNYFGAIIESTPMIEPSVDPEVVAKKKESEVKLEKEKKKITQLASSGNYGTILTSGSGVTEEAETSQTMLGGY